MYTNMYINIYYYFIDYNYQDLFCTIFSNKKKSLYKKKQNIKKNL